RRAILVVNARRRFPSRRLTPSATLALLLTDGPVHPTDHIRSSEKENAMSTCLRIRPSHVIGAVLMLITLAIVLETAQGQAGGIGVRGGQTGPAIPVNSGVPTTPVLPSNLNLSPEATSSLLKGLDQSGTALRPGMGWLARDLTHQGVKGRELADVM